MRLRLPSPSMAVAGTALVVALGGTSYAAVSVSGKDVRNSSLTGADVRNNSLTGADIRNISSGDVRDGALRARDFRRGELPAGARGATGPAGPAGAQGLKGDKGDKGDAGLTRWALVNSSGEIERQSGGFRVVSAYGSNGAPAAAAGNVYIELTGEDLSDNGLLATISLQNGANQNGSANGSNSTDGGAGTANGTNTGGDGTVPAEGDNLEFSGEISIAKCATPGIVACAPPGSNENDTFVVSPRLSDGQRTTAGNRKRFFVTVTG
jgi:hypothetical protein